MTLKTSYECIMYVHFRFCVHLMDIYLFIVNDKDTLAMNLFVALVFLFLNLSRYFSTVLINLILVT